MILVQIMCCFDLNNQSTKKLGDALLLGHSNGFKFRMCFLCSSIVETYIFTVSFVFFKSLCEEDGGTKGELAKCGINNSSYPFLWNC